MKARIARCGPRLCRFARGTAGRGAGVEPPAPPVLSELVAQLPEDRVGPVFPPEIAEVPQRRLQSALAGEREPGVRRDPVPRDGLSLDREDGSRSAGVRRGDHLAVDPEVVLPG